MTASMRIFLVVALVLAGGLGLVRVFDGRSSDATSEPTPTSSGPTSSSVPTSSVPFDATSTTAPAVTSPETSTTNAVTSTVVETTAPPSTLPAMLSSFCPSGAHSAVVDRERQTAWLCDTGQAVYQFPFTGAISQPDAGTYPVYAKDMNSSSSSKAGISRMTHFVAFTYGKFRGARIAFHSLPVWAGNGEWVQPPSSVGDLDRRGESAGCLRVLPDDAVRVWDWLTEGDEVRVIN